MSVMKDLTFFLDKTENRLENNFGKFFYVESYLITNKSEAEYTPKMNCKYFFKTTLLFKCH